MQYLQRHRRYHSSVFFFVLLFVLPDVCPAGTDEAAVRGLITDYLAVAQDVYAPSLPETDADLRVIDQMRAQAKSLWIYPKRASKDFLFLKAHAGMPYALVDFESSGDFARIVVHFKPQPSDEVRAAPVFSPRKGRYSLVHSRNGWKIAEFNLVHKKPVYPVVEDASIDALLDAYFTAMQAVYPVVPQTTFEPHGKKAEEVSLIAARLRTSNYWKLREKDPEVPSMRSAMFFRLYQPSAWTIQQVDEAGDFARARIEMNVGSPLQIKLKRGDFTRQVQYSLVRTGKNWYLIDFEDLDEKARRKAREQAALAEEEPGRPEVGASAQEILDSYFQQLQSLYPSEGIAAAANSVAVMKQTKFYWKLDTHARRATAARSLSFFNLFRPTSWTVEQLHESGDTAEARVAFTIGNSSMRQLNAGRPTKTATYSLVQEGQTWLLSDYSLTP
jgi:hypothetical protein